MLIKVIARTGESGDRLIKRFSGYIKSTGVAKAMRKGRYFRQTPTRRVARASAVKRSEYRAKAAKRQFLN